MACGDEFPLEDVSPFEWGQFRAAHRYSPYSARARDAPQRKAALAGAPAQAAEATYAEQERAFFNRIAAFVQGRATKLLILATPMTKVDTALLD